MTQNLFHGPFGTFVTTYRDGKECGEETYWYKNGIKGAEGQYLAGKKHGTWREWDENGKLIKQEEYRDGSVL